MHVIAIPRLIPAHAGKTRCSPTSRGRCTAHPRSRGENWVLIDAFAISVGSSPLTRGKPDECDADCQGRRLIPAHAGKTPASRPCCPPSSAHPRSRGENLRGVRLCYVEEGSSPLTRGKPCPILYHMPRTGLIPAHAGKTTCPMTGRSTSAAHPRSRGENRL